MGFPYRTDRAALNELDGALEVAEGVGIGAMLGRYLSKSCPTERRIGANIWSVSGNGDIASASDPERIRPNTPGTMGHNSSKTTDGSDLTHRR
jgi:hypothetical protein